MQERALIAGTEEIITGFIAAVSSLDRMACQIDVSAEVRMISEQNTASSPQRDLEEINQHTGDRNTEISPGSKKY